MIRLVRAIPFARELIAMIYQMLSVIPSGTPAAIGKAKLPCIRSIQFKSNGLHISAAWNSILARTVAAVSRLLANAIGTVLKSEIHPGIVTGIIPKHM